MAITTKTFCYILLASLWSSCGDSPFLKEISNEDDTDGQVTNLTQGTVSLTVSSEVNAKGEVLSLRNFWLEGPKLYDESILLVHLTNEQGKFVDPPGELSIYLWMPFMGHGSFPVQIKRLRTGIYEVKDIYFTMENRWDIHFQVITNDNNIAEVQWPLTL